MTEYANSRVLVSTDWLEAHLNDPNVVVVEVGEGRGAYEEGHVPGAVFWDWQVELADKQRRDILGLADLEALMARSGIGNSTTVVLYGDHHNWFAAFAFWQLKIYGHEDARLLNGGRSKWIAEARQLEKDPPNPMSTEYKSMALNQELRAFLPQVKTAAKGRGFSLVDVRSQDEFIGKINSPDGSSAGSVRAGHIPGARCIPWALTCNDDGTFKSADELKALFTAKGVTPDKEIITYCQVGDCSSHTWFVLKHLLGYPRVKNYDGSWIEWGNLVGVPIETGEERA